MDRIKLFLEKTSQYKKETFQGKFLVLFILAYFGTLSVYMLRHNMWFSPDQFIIIGFVLALIVAQPILFLKDWTPFIFLFLSYEYLRGLAPKLGLNVNIYSMIHADKFLFFGKIPTIKLQELFYTQEKLHIYDYVFTIIYMMHFILPLGFAFLLWTTNRKEFKRFSIALLVLSYAGFLTYVLYPAMPPWMASEQGIIPHVYDVFGTTVSTFMKGSSFPSVYNFMNPNPVAAMPSLHAAYPALVYFFSRKIYGNKKSSIMLLYLITVVFAIVYTGNHYVIDAIVGIAYSYAAFRAVEYFWDKKIFSKTSSPSKAEAEII